MGIYIGKWHNNTLSFYARVSWYRSIFQKTVGKAKCS